MRRSVGGQPTLLLSAAIGADTQTREVDDQVDDELLDLLASTVTPLGLELLDVERRDRLVRVVVDRAGGVDLDTISEATRVISAALDRHDPIPGRRYTLEVSSPGVERPLRTPEHFARAVGETVSVRTVSGGQGERRVIGRLAAVDAHGLVIEADDIPGGRRRLGFDEVQRARTVFEWGPASARAGRGAPSRTRARRERAAAKKTGQAQARARGAVAAGKKAGTP
jgi:ribosome maturation factor RimP